MEKILITAHSGAEYTKDNTIESIEQIESYNPDSIEVDLKSTEDLRPCLGHDKGSCDGDFREFSNLIKGKEYLINLDVKDSRVILKSYEILKEDHDLKRFYFSGLSFKGAEEVKGLGINIRFLINLEVEEVKFEDLHFKDYCLELVKRARAMGAFGLNIHYKFATKALINAAKEKDMEIHVWTVDKEEDMRRLRDLGVDSITTKNLKGLKRVLS